MTTIPRVLTAAALASTLAACAGASGSGFTGPHQITILFKADPAHHRDCPVTVTVEPAKQCSSLFAKQKDCLDTKGGQQVIFLAREDDPPAGSGELKFSIDFDPFKQGNNTFTGKKDEALKLTLDPRSPPKEYTYNVFSGSCAPIDPKIIIRP